jgi:hypothetical protein
LTYQSLSNSSGQDEIIKDIEMRVSQLLSEKTKTDKHVWNGVDRSNYCGQPEDYKCEHRKHNSKFCSLKASYRDTES